MQHHSYIWETTMNPKQSPVVRHVQLFDISFLYLIFWYQQLIYDANHFWQSLSSFQSIICNLVLSVVWKALLKPKNTIITLFPLSVSVYQSSQTLIITNAQEWFSRNHNTSLNRRGSVICPFTTYSKNISYTGTVLIGPNSEDFLVFGTFAIYFGV